MSCGSGLASVHAAAAASFARLAPRINSRKLSEIAPSSITDRSGLPFPITAPCSPRNTVRALTMLVLCLLKFGLRGDRHEDHIQRFGNCCIADHNMRGLV